VFLTEFVYSHYLRLLKWPSPLIHMRHRLFIDSSREVIINSRDWLSSDDPLPALRGGVSPWGSWQLPRLLRGYWITQWGWFS